MDNLKAEMQRNGLTISDIMRTIGCSEKTARNKINGETDFTYPEAEEVRNRLFPGMRMEYLVHQPGRPPWFHAFFPGWPLFSDLCYTCTERR